MKKKMSKKLFAFVSFMLCLVLVMSQDAWYRGSAARVTEPDYGKISDQLIDAMKTMGDDDIVEIWLFLYGNDDRYLKRIEREYVMQMTGIDTEAIADDERFEKEFVPSVIDGMNSGNGADASLDRDSAEAQDAIRAKIDAVSRAHLEAVRREQTNYTNAFLEKYVDTDKREISYFGHYTCTLILEATKAEIEKYSTLNEVSSVSLYTDEPEKNTDSIELDQVEASDF